MEWGCNPAISFCVREKYANSVSQISALFIRKSLRRNKTIFVEFFLLRASIRNTILWRLQYQSDLSAYHLATNFILFRFQFYKRMQNCKKWPFMRFILWIWRLFTGHSVRCTHHACTANMYYALFAGMLVRILFLFVQQ